MTDKIDKTDKTQLKALFTDIISLENEEEILKEKMKNLKMKKDKAHDIYINYMSNNDILDKEILFGQYKIKCSSSKIIESISKKRITEQLKIFLKDENLANQATACIYNDRNSTQKISLKIINIKK